MIRRRYLPGVSYDVSFKKEQGVVMRKMSPTSAEEIHIDPRKCRVMEMRVRYSENEVRLLQVCG